MEGKTAVQMIHQRVLARSCRSLLCLLVSLSSGVALAPSTSASVKVSENITSELAKDHIGETNTVCGLVATARYHAEREGKPTYLNFDHAYPNQTFTVTITEAARASFNQPPETLFNEKTVCVTGVIVDRRGKPQIVVDDPMQILVQGESPAVASEPAAKVTTDTTQKTPPVVPPAASTTAKPSSTPPTGAAAKSIPSAQAQQHIGETATVCGLVATARFHATQQGRPTYLNFDHPYPNQTFTVTITEAARAAFSQPPETLFNGKTVCVTGQIVDRRGKPQIVVEKPSQITIQP